MLGLCAMPLLLSRRYWQQPEIPRIVLLPIGLMLLVLVQFALGKIAYLGQALLFSLYMLWAALLIMLGHRLREEFGLPMLATVLAAFLLLGAELNALVGVLQHYRWHTFLDALVTVKIASAVYGSVAQPNHFASYITLGLISIGLLYSRGKLRAWQVLLLATPLLFVLVLSGSRSPWLYLLCMAGITFLWQRQKTSCLPPSTSGSASPAENGLPLALLRYSLLLLLSFGLMHFVVQIPWLAGSSSSVTSVGRMIEEGTASFSEGGDSSTRLHIWHEAWLMFTQFPLLGAGFGQFAWQHFQIAPLMRNTNVIGMYNNAHNLVIQIAVEMGLAGLLVLLGTLILWFWQLRSAQRTTCHWWGCGLLIVLAIHSLLEYPLWYAYFIGVAALTLGMLDSTTYRLKLTGVGRLSVAAILLLGVLSLSQTFRGYRNLESVVAMRPASAADESYSLRLRDGLGGLQSQILLQPYANVLMSSMIVTSADRLADKLVLNESVMRFLPLSQVVYREALLLALAGEQAEAQVQVERAIWSYPGDFPVVREELSSLALKDPGHFAALLEFALRKKEERQRAIYKR